MKNPFVMMALMAAAMSEAFKENKYRDAGMSLPMGRSRSRQQGPKNPAGSKFIRAAFKAKHGHKSESFNQAREWYANYLREKDAAVRARDSARKQQRALRSV